MLEPHEIESEINKFHKCLKEEILRGNYVLQKPLHQENGDKHIPILVHTYSEFPNNEHFLRNYNLTINFIKANNYRTAKWWDMEIYTSYSFMPTINLNDTEKRRLMPIMDIEDKEEEGKKKTAHTENIEELKETINKLKEENERLKGSK